MRKIFFGLLSILSIQSSFADMTCKEYEATVSLKDSWVSCRLDDRFEQTRTSSILAELYLSPEVNNERYSNAYYFVNGGRDATSGMERSTVPEKVISSNVTEAEIEVDFKPSSKKILRFNRFSVSRNSNSNLFGYESLTTPFGGNVEVQFPYVSLFGKVRWSSANNGRFGMSCSLETPVEYESSIVGSSYCSSRSADKRKCQRFLLWKSHRQLIGETVEASSRTYYKPNVDGNIECYVKIKKK